MSDKKIIVYGAEWCAFCHMVRRYLDDKKVEFEYVDVDKDPVRGMQAVEKSGQRGIPVTDFNGEIIIGFDRPRIDAALNSN